MAAVMANGVKESARPVVEDYLKLVDVRKEFDGFVAVDDTNLSIRKGEIFALLGGSGCGKSTLLRCLGGFERPTAGKILLDGQLMNELPPYERPINMMFQSYALFPHMTVEQNIAFGLKQDGLGKAEIAARVEDMLGLVQMGKLARRSRTNCPVANSSAWPWRALWPKVRSCCYWTSRWAPWTKNCARRCNWNWSTSLKNRV
jgi:putrescine transport system ATP-binding protein